MPTLSVSANSVLGVSLRMMLASDTAVVSVSASAWVLVWRRLKVPPQVSLSYEEFSPSSSVSERLDSLDTSSGGSVLEP